tara:strand:+ start:156 stop:419 length:264 start_codon:yes stop_codon:yes gene_type:complete
MITNTFYSTKLVLNRNLSPDQLQCSPIELIAICASEFKSIAIPGLLMIVPSQQSEKLSQLEVMLEGNFAGPLPTADRLELRRLADAL